METETLLTPRRQMDRSSQALCKRKAESPKAERPQCLACAGRAQTCLIFRRHCCNCFTKKWPEQASVMRAARNAQGRTLRPLLRKQCPDCNGMAQTNAVFRGRCKKCFGKQWPADAAVLRQRRREADVDKTCSRCTKPASHGYTEMFRGRCAQYAPSTYERHTCVALNIPATYTMPSNALNENLRCLNHLEKQEVTNIAFNVLA